MALLKSMKSIFKFYTSRIEQRKMDANIERDETSVIGSLLESEPHLNAFYQWCNLDPFRCVEVTWGDGNRMYIGEAGGLTMNLENRLISKQIFTSSY